MNFKRYDMNDDSLKQILGIVFIAIGLLIMAVFIILILIFGYRAYNGIIGRF